MAESADTKVWGTYEAGCHCGHIGLSLKISPPLPEHVVLNCNCSICRRAGYLLVYPQYSEVTWRGDSEERVSRYIFNTRTRDHMFCGKCGASIGIDFRENDPKRYGISVRAIKGIDLDKLTYEKFDGMHKLGPAEDIADDQIWGSKGGNMFPGKGDSVGLNRHRHNIIGHTTLFDPGMAPIVVMFLGQLKGPWQWEHEHP
ncbi:hypothetical protein G7046_g8377 [Stylonectria norvegica]|nr:hypothetical protein G7046_g8377 [Stylonectria norvegica]